jgi:ribosomal protein L17
LAEFDRGMETFCLTFGQFSLLDAVIALLGKTGPAHVVVSTWTAGSADLTRSAALLHDARILSMRWVVDCSFPQRQPGYAAELLRLFGAEAIRTTRTHAKFVVIHNDEWKVVARTSMNLNSNPRLESIEVTDSAKLAEFLLDVVKQIYAEEEPGGYTTKTTPTLAGMPALQPAATVSMAPMPRVGP